MEILHTLLIHNKIIKTMEKPKSITWKELKEFANSIPEEFINNEASLLIGDESTSRVLNEPFFIENDIYCNKEDNEDCASMEELRNAHMYDEDEFNEDDYVLVTKKGTPFLWSD